MVSELTAVIARQAGTYVAACLELDVKSVGDSPEEARDRLINALQHHIDDACETHSVPQRHRNSSLAALLEQTKKGEGFFVKLPEYLITRT